jgi:diguanylate cyclase (GGDEF)-like protein
MNKVTLGGDDGFWARLRAALGRDPQDARSSLGDARNAQKLARPIDESFSRAWGEAAERKVSLCVLALEIDGYADYFAAYGGDAVEESLAVLEAAINNASPREDFPALRSGAAGFLLMLPDTPALMARELAARIAVAVRHAGLPHRESHAGHVTLSMGLAVVNPEDAPDRNVLSGAAEAVRKAQRRGIGRLETVDYRTAADRRSKAA